MAQRSIVTIEDVTRVDFESRRLGCDKGVMHVEKGVQIAVFRVAPGSGVPVHLHSTVYDMFVGIKGQLDIRYEGQIEHGKFELKPGAFCAMPAGVRHEVFNPTSEDAYFLSIHAPHIGYDFVPCDFRSMEACLGDRSYIARQCVISRDAAA